MWAVQVDGPLLTANVGKRINCSPSSTDDAYPRAEGQRQAAVTYSHAAMRRRQIPITKTPFLLLAVDSSRLRLVRSTELVMIGSVHGRGQQQVGELEAQEVALHTLMLKVLAGAPLAPGNFLVAARTIPRGRRR